MSASSIVEIRRGALVESSHRVSIVVVDGAGHVRATSGDPDLVVFARSAVKPVQAQPLVDDGVLERFGWGDPELALACASHSGEAQHVDLAGTMLESIGVGENALACGAHVPFDDAAARLLRDRGMLPRRLHNNCSGKHAGMLALAAVHGWRLDGYNDPAHPVQRRMLEEMVRWSGVGASDIGVAVDGCGVATFALPLRALAATFGALARGARSGAGPAARVVGAMTRFPELVGGTGRLCTELMRVGGGRIFAKVGAEGVYCAGAPGAELGIALKVEDGARRAAEPALLAVLRLLGLLDDAGLQRLQAFATPAIRNTRNDIVGEIRARITLEAVNG